MKPNHPPKLGAIVIAVELEFDLPRGALYERSNRQAVVYPRQIAWWLMRDMTPASYPDIQNKFGFKDHQTVIHGVRKIQARLDGNEELRIMGNANLRAIVERLRAAVLESFPQEIPKKYSPSVDRTRV